MEGRVEVDGYRKGEKGWGMVGVYRAHSGENDKITGK
jgi:hypothetical protein